MTNGKPCPLVLFPTFETEKVILHNGEYLRKAKVIFAQTPVLNPSKFGAYS
jgi:hypothetical protein